MSKFFFGLVMMPDMMLWPVAQVTEAHVWRRCCSRGSAVVLERVEDPGPQSGPPFEYDDMSFIVIFKAVAWRCCSRRVAAEVGNGIIMCNVTAWRVLRCRLSYFKSV